jgi:tetratricopeptide (TPR) repeat protein
MEFKLKTISQAGIDEANRKAERYRFLNQPWEAESICRDVLAVDPENQLALRNLGLAITDQFTGHLTDQFGHVKDRPTEAENAFLKLTDPYERLYYIGIMHERRAKSQLAAGFPPYALFSIFEDAMRCFREAEDIRPPANDDAILHWNSCVRLLQSKAPKEWERRVAEMEEAVDLETGDTRPV